MLFNVLDYNHDNRVAYAWFLLILLVENNGARKSRRRERGAEPCKVTSDKIIAPSLVIAVDILSIF